MIRTSGLPQELSDKLEVVSRLMKDREECTPIERLLFDVLTELLEEGAQQTPPPATPELTAVRGFADLTPRERQVMDQIVGGSSNKQAGRHLGISPRTVEVHRRRLMAKLQVPNTVTLVRMAMQYGDGPRPVGNDRTEEK